MLAKMKQQQPQAELPTLQITLLGHFSLTYGNQPITRVNTERLQSLLAYLLLHRGIPQSRQRLAFCFWADSNDTQARTNLRRELYHLRQAFPEIDRYIEINTKALQWRTDVPFVLDVAAFEQAIATAEQAEQQGDRATLKAALEQAAELYQAPLLPGCYDDWILPEQERLQQVCIRALENLMRLLQTEGDYRAAIRYGQQLLRIEPLHEATYRDLMTLSALNGDRANALRFYQQCVTLLERELGVEPDPITRSTYEQLLKTEIPTTASLTTAPTPLTAPPPIVLERSSSSSTTRLPLVGRQVEWNSIEQWFTAASSGDAPVLLLSGEPGIGKTRLLEELENKVKATQGKVLWGQGFAAEILRSYGVWIDALRAIAQDFTLPLPSELKVLLPGMATMSEVLGDRSRLFDAVVQLLSQLATGSTPIVLILDDIQWLDEASTALLHYAIRLLKNSSLLFACAARHRELEENQPIFKFIQALRREHRLQTIELAPLDLQNTLQLARTFNEDIHDQQVFVDSGGNPLFILEVARARMHPEANHSHTLEALICDRFQQLDATSNELLTWASALGHSFNPTILAHIADCSMLKLLPAMEKLEQQGIIRPKPSTNGEIGYNFVHDIVRQVAYQQLSEPRRCLAHQHIAQMLHQIATSDSALASEIAHHASLGKDHELAATACLKAANHSLQLFAYTEASELAQRGIEHCQHLEARQSVRLRLDLFNVYARTGLTKEMMPQLEQDLRQLIELAHSLDLKDEAATGAALLLMLNFEQGNFNALQINSFQAIASSRVASPAVHAWSMANTGACLAAIGKEMERAEAILLEAQSLAERVDLQLMDIFIGLGIVRHHTGDWVEARRLLEQAWHLAQVEHDHWQECLALIQLTMLELEADRLSIALTYVKTLAIVAAKMGEGSESAFAAALQALAHYALAEPQANYDLEQALLTLRQIDSQRMLAYTLTFAATVDLQCDRIDLAIARTREALRAAKRIDHTNEIASAWIILIQALLTRGDRTQALAAWQQLQNEVELYLLSDRTRTTIERMMSFKL
jgi:DNA-binding SARP family transcriptional activator/predicted ATPase